MTQFVVYPGIDENLEFPPAVRQKLADAPELKGAFVRFEDQNGNPLPTRNVVIKVDSTTGDIIDIVSET
jgi:hypothetical protein